MMKFLRLYMIVMMCLAPLTSLEAKGYSSGSHSSSSSSRSSSSSSHSSSSSSSHRSYSSGSRSTYSSGSSSRSTYSPARTYSSSAKSYTANSSHTYSSGSATASTTTHSSSPSSKSSSPFTFDSSAASASKQVTSQRDYNSAHTPRPVASSTHSTQPSSSSTTWFPTTRTTPARPTIILSDDIYRTRPARYSRTYAPYRSRPVVIYNDPIDSFFWYWLLDQSADTRASWAYHHRHTIDSARYQTLLNNDTAVADRVAALEQEAIRRDADFTPQGIEPDLMYTDTHINDAYASRPTSLGLIMFWIFMGPLILILGGGLIWFIFFKRW